MIHFLTGNLFDSDSSALVNTVNTVGVMGKGIALQFKEAYPYNYSVYRKACKNQELTTGTILAVADHDAFGNRTIINFPTKQHWRQKSTYPYIESGLKALKEYLQKEKISSISIPPLGCGNGGLDWERVKQLIIAELSDLATLIYVFEPNPGIQKNLQDLNNDQDLKMTPARAMLLSALYEYESEGEPISLFVATKLVYLLQLLGGPFNDKRLVFKRSYYGPYSPGMNHFVRAFNGSYLKGLEQNEARPFDPLPLNYDKRNELKEYLSKEISSENQVVLNNLKRLVDGYQSAFGLEILSTVAFIRAENPNYSVDDILQEAKKWSTRKANMLKPRFVKQAVEHLDNYAENIFQ